MFAQDADVMDKVKELIETQAKEKKVQIYEGTGPAFDAEMVKEVHESKTIWCRSSCF